MSIFTNNIRLWIAASVIGCSAGAAANTVAIYKSIGAFGEVKFTQIAPTNATFETLIIQLPQSTQNSDRCTVLRNNLSVLNAGGIIHEIDAQGNKIRLSDSEVIARKASIQAALAACDGK